jgi:hypothetical protein
MPKTRITMVAPLNSPIFNDDKRGAALNDAANDASVNRIAARPTIVTNRIVSRMVIAAEAH